MAPPTWVSTTDTAFNLTGTSKTLSLTCQAGDCLVLVAMSGDAGTLVSSVSGPAGVTWTARAAAAGVASSNAPIKTWSMDSAPAVSAGTVTVTYGNTNNVTAASLYVFRGAVYGTSVATAATVNGVATASITTTAADSGVVVVSLDWNAIDGTTRAYSTATAGAFTEKTYYRDTTNWAVYGGFYADDGTVGAKTVGVTTPGATQRPTVAAIEVVGTGGTPAFTMPAPLVASWAVQRAANW